jgi:hypothetical protein
VLKSEGEAVPGLIHRILLGLRRRQTAILAGGAVIEALRAAVSEAAFAGGFFLPRPIGVVKSSASPLVLTPRLSANGSR